MILACRSLFSVISAALAPAAPAAGRGAGAAAPGRGGALAARGALDGAPAGGRARRTGHDLDPALGPRESAAADPVDRPARWDPTARGPGAAAADVARGAAGALRRAAR